jgi:hypothetical protein
VRRALLLGLVVALAAPGAAQATTVSGTLTGAKLAKKGKGVAAVRAITVETGVVGGAKRTRTGSFALQLPPARYLLLASTTPFRGRSASADGPAMRLRVTNKPKRKLKVRAKKKKHRKHKAHHAARPGYVDVDYPAIWVKHFDTSDANVELRVMGKGIADMLITDLSAFGPPSCPTAPVVVEREHLDAVIAEIDLSNSPAADPSTAVPRGHLIEHNMIITGKLRTAGTKLTVEANVQDLRTNRTFPTSVSGDANSVFDLETQLVAKLKALICFPPPVIQDQPPPSTCAPTRQTCNPLPTGHPISYNGSVSGTRRHVQEGLDMTINWTGPVNYGYVERHAMGQANAPPGDYWYFQPTAGTVHVTLNAVVDKCSWSGSADFNVSTGSENTSSVQADTAAPYYFLQGLFAPGDQVPFTKTGDPSCDGTGTWPLYGMAWATSKDATPSSSTTLVGSADQDYGDGLTDHWSWNLGPQF